MTKDELDDLVFTIELKQEIESLERKIGPYVPLTDEEITNLKPLEISPEIIKECKRDYVEFCIMELLCKNNL